jgi:hypothetical protein
MSKQSFVILSTTEGRVYLTHTATVNTPKHVTQFYLIFNKTAKFASSHHFLWCFLNNITVFQPESFCWSLSVHPTGSSHGRTPTPPSSIWDYGSSASTDSGPLFTILSLILNCSWEDTHSLLLNMGLWEFCFYRFRSLIVYGTLS